MASSLRGRRHCMIVMLSGSLLFLPLTVGTNNNASAQPQLLTPSEYYEYQRRAYEDNLKRWLEFSMQWRHDCIEAQNHVNSITGGGFDAHCDEVWLGEPPEPPLPPQPLDCNELQSCPSDSASKPDIFPNDPRRLECGYEPYNCPFKTRCDNGKKLCEVVGCGLGDKNCPTCPPGGNPWPIFRAWCSYQCYPTGQAIIFKSKIGDFAIGPFCSEGPTF